MHFSGTRRVATVRPADELSCLARAGCAGRAHFRLEKFWGVKSADDGVLCTGDGAATLLMMSNRVICVLCEDLGARV